MTECLTGFGEVELSAKTDLGELVALQRIIRLSVKARLGMCHWDVHL